jgi:dihydroneopterin aldolase
VIVLVEIHGFELHGRHGVNEDEREQGQAFLFDVKLEVDEPGDDSVTATVDYREVREVVRATSDEHAYRLLESLAGAVADAIVARFDVRSVTVRVRKPGVAWAEWTAVTVTRSKP